MREVGIWSGGLLQVPLRTPMARRGAPHAAASPASLRLTCGSIRCLRCSLLLLLLLWLEVSGPRSCQRCRLLLLLKLLL